MEDLFYTNLKEINEERNARWHRENNMYKARGEDIYALFVLTCLGEDRRDKINDDKAFAQFLKDENIELTKVQRRYLAEKYFNWEYYEYDYEKKDWKKRKVK